MKSKGLNTLLDSGGFAGRLDLPPEEHHETTERLGESDRVHRQSDSGVGAGEAAPPGSAEDQRLDALAEKFVQESPEYRARQDSLVTQSPVSMFERLALDPNVPVEKLEALLSMQERITAHNAKAAFNAAFAEMQGEIPLIEEKGQIIVNGQVRSNYARLEDILEVIRPILQRHGFALRHRNEFTDGQIKIIGILSHREGHSEQDEFVAKADNSGSKNDIQALGSTRAYGQRYTTLALLGIATKGVDDDGADSEKGKAPTTPKGYDEWLADLEATAGNGWSAFESAWREAKPQYRTYAAQHDKARGARIKAKAQQVPS